jgi:hypothetical protein
MTDEPAPEPGGGRTIAPHPVPVKASTARPLTSLRRSGGDVTGVTVGLAVRLGAFDGRRYACAGGAPVRWSHSRLHHRLAEPPERPAEPLRLTAEVGVRDASDWPFGLGATLPARAWALRRWRRDAAADAWPARCAEFGRGWAGSRPPPARRPVLSLWVGALSVRCRGPPCRSTDVEVQDAGASGHGRRARRQCGLVV